MLTLYFALSNNFNRTIVSFYIIIEVNEKFQIIIPSENRYNHMVHLV